MISEKIPQIIVIVKVFIEFLINLPKFAFYDDLKTVLDVDDSGIKKLIDKSPAVILEAVLFDKGLNYSSKPKGAIKFHKYGLKTEQLLKSKFMNRYNTSLIKTVMLKFILQSPKNTQIYLKQLLMNLKSKLPSDHKT